MAGAVEKDVCAELQYQQIHLDIHTFSWTILSESTDREDMIDGNAPLGNRLYRYELVNNKLVNPKLLLDLPAYPGPRHNGGAIAIGPDNNLYITVGDIDGTFKEEVTVRFTRIILMG